MLRHLVGENLDVPGVTALENLIDELEPVKHYRRGGLQIWSNQLVPLVGFADAARPDSAPCRFLAGLVDQALFTGPAIDKDAAKHAAAVMKVWGQSAKAIDALAVTYPAVREAIIPAHGVVSSCAVGEAAVRSLVSGTPLEEAQLSADMAALDVAGAYNESATEFPAIRSIRLLVAAAARHQSAAGMKPGEWRALVQATAFPPGSFASQAP